MDLPTKTSIETLQIGRAFAAIAVVLYHTEVTLGLDKYLGRGIFPIFYSGDSGVYYFFVLSGFVMATAHADEFGRQGVVLPFLWKRFRRLYPTLWVVLATQVLLFLVVRQDRIPTADLPWTALKDFLILPWHGPSLLSVEWTLRHEVLFYLAFAGALALPRMRWLVAATSLAAISVGLTVAIPEPIDRLVSGYNLLFAFGILAAVLYRRGVVPAPHLLVILGVSLFSANWIALAVGLYSRTLVAIWTYGIAAALIICGAAAIERKGGLRAPAIALLLGDASYSIYLVHYPAVVLTCKIIAPLNRDHPALDTIAFIAVAGLAAAAGTAFHLAIERPLLRLLPQRFGSSVRSVNAEARS